MTNFLVVFTYRRNQESGVGNTTVVCDGLLADSILRIQDTLKEQEGYTDVVITNVIPLSG